MNIIITYIASLHSIGWRGKRISQHVTSIKQFDLFIGNDIDLYDHPRVSQAIKASNYTTEEAKAISSVKQQTRQVPINQSMVDSCRERLWIEDSSTRESMDKKAIYLAISLGLNTGRRISNLVHRSSTRDEDHCIRAGDLEIITSDCRGTLRGGSNLRRYLATSGGPNWSGVEKVLLYFHTQKERKKDHIQLNPPVIIDRSTGNQEQLMKDLLHWVVISGCLEEDELLTRYHNGVRKCLTRKQVTSELKKMAMLAGINENRIGTRSLRVGYATQQSVEQGGKLDEPSKMRAGWSSKSRVPDRIYVRPMPDDSIPGNDGEVSSQEGEEYIDSLEPE